MSTRIAQSSMALRPTMPAIQRGFRTTTQLRNNEKDPVGPKSQDKPMGKGQNSQTMMLGGVGLAIGAGFFFLMSRPDVAKDQPVQGVTSKPVRPK
ncbi:hypothetical protein F66182_2240 [Fusarium sp. NRRL 66182]|nr:hypothetical protein F66182_2240 [Fusarium sp. NRRL 66182]